MAALTPPRKRWSYVVFWDIEQGCSLRGSHPAPAPGKEPFSELSRRDYLTGLRTHVSILTGAISFDTAIVHISEPELFVRQRTPPPGEPDTRQPVACRAHTGARLFSS